MTWFSPPGVTWISVSSRLATARLVLWWIFVACLAAPALVVASSEGSAWWVLPITLLLLGVWVSWIIVRQVSAHAWAERDDDLMVRRGRLFRRVTVVPYGRMQFVDVEAGPLSRGLGIARVQLHTASPGSDAHISGVPTEEAARLRDRLTTRGEAKLAGL
ncbi:MAG: PH domain-containing protein [Demequinaceae bacterium]|nr:PH domain-containing protein [Demequinaceae bacterium]